LDDSDTKPLPKIRIQSLDLNISPDEEHPCQILEGINNTRDVRIVRRRPMDVESFLNSLVNSSENKSKISSQYSARIEENKSKISSQNSAGIEENKSKISSKDSERIEENKSKISSKDSARIEENKSKISSKDSIGIKDKHESDNRQSKSNYYNLLLNSNIFIESSDYDTTLNYYVNSSRMSLSDDSKFTYEVQPEFSYRNWILESKNRGTMSDSGILSESNDHFMISNDGILPGSSNQSTTSDGDGVSKCMNK
jgi:hypothetical protein